MVLDRILGLMGLFVLAGISGRSPWPFAGTVIRRLIVIVWVFLGLSVLGLLAIFGQALTRRYPGLLEGHGRVALLLRRVDDLSSTYRRKLGVVAGALTSGVDQPRPQRHRVLPGQPDDLSDQPTPLPGTTLLDGSLDLVHHGRPDPVRSAPALTERVSKQLFQLVDHPHGDLAMMGFRVLMYAGALVSGCFYLANLKQVRGLSDTAEHLEEELLERRTRAGRL